VCSWKGTATGTGHRGALQPHQVGVSISWVAASAAVPVGCWAERFGPYKAAQAAFEGQLVHTLHAATELQGRICSRGVEDVFDALKVYSQLAGCSYRDRTQRCMEVHEAGIISGVAACAAVPVGCWAERLRPYKAAQAACKGQLVHALHADKETHRLMVTQGTSTDRLHAQGCLCHNLLHALNAPLTQVPDQPWRHAHS
jgi:hypothetical protein